MWSDTVAFVLGAIATLVLVLRFNQLSINESLLRACSWDFSAFFLFLLEHECITKDNSLNFKKLRFASAHVIGKVAGKYLCCHDTVISPQHGLECAENVYTQSAVNLLEARYDDKKIKLVFAAMQEYNKYTYYYFERIYFRRLGTATERRK